MERRRDERGYSSPEELKEVHCCWTRGTREENEPGGVSRARSSRDLSTLAWRCGVTPALGLFLGTRSFWPLGQL